MESGYVPRPEDFRLAWSNAYRVTLLQVGEMQARADIQLKKSEEILACLDQNAEYFRKNLYDTGAVILQRLRQTATTNEAEINAATAQLLTQAKAMLIKEYQTRSDIAGLLSQLLEERRQFEVKKGRMAGQPLWVRIWHAVKNQN